MSNRRGNMNVTSRITEIENDLRDYRKSTDDNFVKVYDKFDQVFKVLNQLATSVAKQEDRQGPGYIAIASILIASIVCLVTVIGGAVAAVTYISSAAASSVRTEMTAEIRVMGERLKHLERITYADHRRKKPDMTKYGK